MVMISRLAIASTAAALFGVALADLQITNPASNLWWVAKSQNVLTWSCKDSSFSSFTVLIGNKDQNVLTAPIAIIGIQNNFDCSKIITQDVASQPAGVGYTILLANPVNISQVYATSQEFEIKPLGSAYPATTTPGGPTTTGNTTAPASSTTGSKPNDAISFTTSFGFGLAAAGAVLGLMAA